MPQQGAALYAERTGAGPRVVLVHGFTQTGRSWAKVAGRLAANHEVVTVDLPRHGRSGLVGAADLDEAGRLLAAAGGRGCYVGYSMGGRVALHAALSAPETVRALVLVGATAGIADEVARSQRRRADEALVERLEGGLGLEDFLDEWLSGPLFGHLSDEQAGRQARRENTPAGLAGALRTLGTGTQSYDPDRLGRLSMPLLVAAGGDDEKFCAEGLQLASLVGERATFASLAGVGHAAPFEDPEGFCELVERFCAPGGT